MGAPEIDISEFLTNKENRKLGHDELNRRVACLIWDREKKKKHAAYMGTNGVSYHFSRTDGQLFPIGTRNAPGVEFKNYILTKHQINAAQSLMPFIVEHFIAQSVRARREVHHFAYYDIKKHCLYVDQYNGRVWKLTGNAITDIVNGDEVLFASIGGIPCDDVDIADHKLFYKIVVEGQNYLTESISAESQKILLASWIFTKPFNTLLPGTLLLIIEGQAGSGKTTAIKKIQEALVGQQANVHLNTRREDDFPIALLRNPYALLDNVDGYVSWLPDKIAAYCTGAVEVRRALYSNTEEITIKPSSWIAVTSRNPSSFRRDDIADRSSILRLGRLDSFALEATMMSEIRELRPKLLGEFLWICNRVVANLKSGAKVSSSYRMSDLAYLTSAVCRALDFSDEQCETALREAQSERNVLSAEGNPILQILHDWVTYRVQNTTPNEGRRLSTKQLHDALSVHSNISHVEYKIKSARSLGRLLRDMDEAIKLTFEVENPEIHGLRHYSFKSKRNAADILG